MSESVHLWDVEHPYYCNKGNYFARNDNDCYCHYESWYDFIKAEGDADPDLNLLFRFDWDAPRDGRGEQIKWHSDEYYRDSTLELFFMGQRKGLYRWATVSVCRADEPAVLEYLRVRWEHMQTLWLPFSLTLEYRPNGNV